MDSTPLSLLQRLRQPGQPEAWAQFVEIYTPYLYLWARRLGLQESDAADLVQDVLLQVFRKLPHFDYRPQGTFRGWLYTVTVNKLRASTRRRDLLQSLAADAAAPDARARQEEIEYRNHLVRQGLRVIEPTVPARIWQIFADHVLSERPAQEVADRLGLSVGTVYAAKSRVLTRLRQELEGLVEWD